MGAAEGGGVLGVESSAESGSWIFLGKKSRQKKKVFQTFQTEMGKMGQKWKMDEIGRWKLKLFFFWVL